MTSATPGMLRLSRAGTRTIVDEPPANAQLRVIEGVVQVDSRGRLCLTAAYARLLTRGTSVSSRRVLVLADSPFEHALLVGLWRVRAVVDATGGAA